MSNKVIIHIGQKKTGTTALQTFFLDNRAWLLGKGILYPSAGRQNFSGQPHHRHMLLSRKADERPELLDRLRTELDRHFDSGGHAALLSSEGYASYADLPNGPALMDSLVQALDPYCVEVVAYLRPQEEFVQSFYNWQVKADKEYGRFRDFVPREIESNPGLYDYAQMLDPWARAFGKEHVLVRRYGREYFKGSSLIADFLQVLDLPQALKNGRCKLPGKRVNTGLSPKVLEMARFVKPMVGMDSWDQFMEMLVLSLGKEQGGARYNMLDDRQLQALRERFARSNATVARRYLGEATGELFPGAGRLEPYEPPPEITSVDWIHLMGLLWNICTGTARKLLETQAQMDQLRQDSLNALRRVARAAMPSEAAARERSAAARALHT